MPLCSAVKLISTVFCKASFAFPFTGSKKYVFKMCVCSERETQRERERGGREGSIVPCHHTNAIYGHIYTKILK